MTSQEILKQLQQKTEENRTNIVQFMREICAIPSVESLIGPVGERIAEEISEFYQQLGSFTGYLWARRDGHNGAAFRAQRYPQLCSQPHIQQALGRVRTEKKLDKDLA